MISLSRLFALGHSFLFALFFWCPLGCFGLLSPSLELAETLFRENLHADALPIYEKLYQSASDPDRQEQLGLRFAQCLLEEDCIEKALETLSSLVVQKDAVLFWISACHKKRGDSRAALQCLERCTAPLCSHLGRRVALEKGCHLAGLSEISQAQTVLNGIAFDAQDPAPFAFARVQLAKIALKESDSQKALTFLSQIPPSFLPEGCLYLKGWAFLGLGHPKKALSCFERLMAQATPSLWYSALLRAALAACLRLALETEDKQSANHFLSQGRSYLAQLQDAPALKTALSAQISEKSTHLLSIDFYLIQSHLQNDPVSYERAIDLIQKKTPALSEEELLEVLFKQAAAAPSQTERERLLNELKERWRTSSFQTARLLFFKGLVELHTGLRLDKQLLYGGKEAFKRAADAFGCCADGAALAPSICLEAKKYQALALFALPDRGSQMGAWQAANELSAASTETFSDGILLACKIALKLNEPFFLRQAEELLKRIEKPVATKIYLEGLIALKLGKLEEADAFFCSLIDDKDLACQAWFWRGDIARLQSKKELQIAYFQSCCANNPSHPFAPFAYFYCYTPLEYMHGGKKALKHLEAMPLLFPDHPLAVNASFLLGLSCIKDLLSEEGKIIRKRDLSKAIEAFNCAESRFESLVAQNKIAQSELAYYAHLRDRACLERAKANFQIAREAEGGKKSIYQLYTEELLCTLIAAFETDSLSTKQGGVCAPHSNVWAEASLYLARLYQEQNFSEKACAALDHMLELFHKGAVAKSPFLMSACTLRGKLAYQLGFFEQALAFFDWAESASGTSASTNPSEKLELWILQSLCCKELARFDEAMRLLSKVINDETVSSLRVKAMLMRADLYEQTGRPKLAIKQLEAAYQKGGAFGKQAKEKLEKYYGYSLPTHHR